MFEHRQVDVFKGKFRRFRIFLKVLLFFCNIIRKKFQGKNLEEDEIDSISKPFHNFKLMIYHCHYHYLQFQGSQGITFTLKMERLILSEILTTILPTVLIILVKKDV